MTREAARPPSTGGEQASVDGFRPELFEALALNKSPSVLSPAELSPTSSRYPTFTNVRYKR